MLHTQAQFNVDLLKREARRKIEFDRSRAEWNSLYYEVLHNLVLETTRMGIEVQNLRMKTESLSSRLDFSERRVRALEGVVQYRPEAVRSTDTRGRGGARAGAAGAGRIRRRLRARRRAQQGQGDGSGRKRRRRRRGRRGRESGCLGCHGCLRVHKVHRVRRVLGRRTPRYMKPAKTASTKVMISKTAKR